MSQYKTAVSMAALDVQRYDILMKAADDLGIELNSGVAKANNHYTNIKYYLGVLNQLYVLFNKMFNLDDMKKLNDIRSDINDLMKGLNIRSATYSEEILYSIPRQLIPKLSEFHSELNWAIQGVVNSNLKIADKKEAENVKRR